MKFVETEFMLTLFVFFPFLFLLALQWIAFYSTVAQETYATVSYCLNENQFLFIVGW